MHKNRILRLLGQTVQAVLMVLLVSFALDWWRRPAQPEHFSARPVATLGGGTVVLAELSRGRTAAVYFWGSWCGICKHTSPAVQKLHRAGVPVLGVALQSGSEQDVRAYMRAHQLDFDTANDPQGDVSRRWQVAVTPTLVLVKDGRMIHSTTGISSYWGLRARIWLADLVY